MDYLCYGARVDISSFNLKNIMSEETNIPAVEEVVVDAAEEVVADTAEAAPEAASTEEAAA